MKYNDYVYKFSTHDFCGNEINCYDWDTLPTNTNPFEYLKNYKRDYVYFTNPYNKETEKLTLSAIIPCRNSKQAVTLVRTLTQSETRRIKQW